MKKRKQKIQKIFDDENYNNLEGRRFIKDFLKTNRKKIKNDDALKLMIRYCISQYERYKTYDSDTIRNSGSITNTNW